LLEDFLAKRFVCKLILANKPAKVNKRKKELAPLFLFLLLPFVELFCHICHSDPFFIEKSPSSAVKRGICSVAVLLFCDFLPSPPERAGREELKSYSG
jgi:hypothetical protein